MEWGKLSILCVDHGCDEVVVLQWNREEKCKKERSWSWMVYG
jgi:hypothetical protein